MSTKPADNLTITAVIPAYNAASHIARAIDSVLGQSRPADEIIVVDDGSTDNTAEVVAKYGENVRYIHQQNAGASAARNTGISAARSEWIAFLDSDDEWLSDKLALQSELLEQNPDIVWATSNYYRCLSDKNIQRPHADSSKIADLFHDHTGIMNFFDAFKAEVYGCTDTMIVRKDALISAGLFPVGQTRAEDMDLWFRIAFQWPTIACANQPLAIYNLSIVNSASRTFKDWNIYSSMIKRNLKIAGESGRLDEFSPAAAYILRRWMRAMLFDAEKTAIRSMLKQFSELLTRPYKTTMYILTICPALTTFACRSISCILRIVPLRRHTVRQPITKKT